MNRKTLLFVLTLLVVSAMLASCGTAATPAPTQAPAATAAMPAMPAATTAPAAPAATAAMPAATTAAYVPAATPAGTPGTGVAQGYNGNVVSSVPANLVTACKAEGTVTIIATPNWWANYGEIFADFETTTGATINSLNPDAGSADELTAIQANKSNKGPQAPDIVDVGYAYGAKGIAAGDYQPYKFSTWDKMPATVLGLPSTDPNGMWSVAYYGTLVFETNAAVVQNPPKTWSDLLKPEYKGQVALSGPAITSNQAQQVIIAAGLSSGGTLDNAQPGLDFFKKLNDEGNFVPVVEKPGTLALGATPITVSWDYIAFGDQATFAGNPPIVISYPSPTIGGAYVQAISAYAPHPNCAKVWMEILHSDQGQLAYLRGHASVISEADMIARGVVPADVLAQLPDPKILASAVAPSADQLKAAAALISTGWMTTVGAAQATATPLPVTPTP
jgi:putative spermidine/putrescine transport system substrate-binding protein